MHSMVSRRLKYMVGERLTPHGCYVFTNCLLIKFFSDHIHMFSIMLFMFPEHHIHMNSYVEVI